MLRRIQKIQKAHVRKCFVIYRDFTITIIPTLITYLRGMLVSGDGGEGNTRP